MKTKRFSVHPPKPNYWCTSMHLFFARMMQDPHQPCPLHWLWCRYRSSQLRSCIGGFLVSIPQKGLVLMTFTRWWYAGLLIFLAELMSKPFADSLTTAVVPTDWRLGIIWSRSLSIRPWIYQHYFVDKLHRTIGKKWPWHPTNELYLVRTAPFLTNKNWWHMNTNVEGFLCAVNTVT